LPYIVGLYITRNGVPSGCRAPVVGDTVISGSDPRTRCAVKGTESLKNKNHNWKNFNHTYRVGLHSLKDKRDSLLSPIESICIVSSGRADKAQKLTGRTHKPPPLSNMKRSHTHLNKEKQFTPNSSRFKTHRKAFAGAKDTLKTRTTSLSL
jgi:hypothetical protein